jgi:hypothetical protein
MTAFRPDFRPTAATGSSYVGHDCAVKQRLVIAGVVVVAALVGWVAWTQVSDGGGGGRPVVDSVVGRINTETDCAALQGEFDRAQTNRRTDWMQAADARMRAMECYGR